MKDYFREGRFILLNLKGRVAPEVLNQIISDLDNYREYLLRQYNNDNKKATDEHNFRAFLNDYTKAVNVFGLHKNLTKRPFNRVIAILWSTVVYKK